MTCANWSITILALLIAASTYWPTLFGGATQWVIYAAVLLTIVVVWKACCCICNCCGECEMEAPKKSKKK